MKLEGITVIDLSLFLPGPAATQMMADHGARVIKVENPRAPEPTRSPAAFPWQQGGETVMLRNTQRGKESIALDLKSEAGKAALRELIKGADVLVEAFRPGVMARLGFDQETVREVNPKLVYCSISAFGQTGPWRDRPAHDTATVAASGVLSLSCSPEDPNGGPAIVGVAMSDMLSSYLALSGVLMALLRRETTGLGDYLDISMHESVLAASPNILGPVFGAMKRRIDSMNEAMGAAPCSMFTALRMIGFSPWVAVNTSLFRHYSRVWAAPSSLKPCADPQGPVTGKPLLFCEPLFRNGL